MGEWITLPRIAGNVLTIIMFIALFRNENFLHRCLVCWKNNVQGVMEWHQLRATLPAIRRGKKWGVFQQFNIYDIIPRKRLELSLTDCSKMRRKTFCRRILQRGVWCYVSSFTVILWGNTDSARITACEIAERNN